MDHQNNHGKHTNICHFPYFHVNFFCPRPLSPHMVILPSALSFLFSVHPQYCCSHTDFAQSKSEQRTKSEYAEIYILPLFLLCFSSFIPVPQKFPYVSIHVTLKTQVFSSDFKCSLFSYVIAAHS